MSDPSKCAGCGRQFTEGSLMDALTKGVYCLPCQGVSLGGMLYKDSKDLKTAQDTACAAYGLSRSIMRRQAIQRSPRGL